MISSQGDVQLLRYHKMINIWTPLLLYSDLFNFDSPSPLQSLKLYFNPPSTTTFPAITTPIENRKFCDFIVL